MSKIADLRLRPCVVAELAKLGFVTPADLDHLSNAEILRMPGVSGKDWRALAAAMGRDPCSGASAKS
ncbi:hypothetical protein ACFOEZ_01070 [Tianweitania populi]|uniref:Uncharacterized protein n=1 Tax=Tianweitania populi TaxID=1607949 RepID=A0A8J3GJ33_9HYPH|nr:hypothetical protein [Tianweitania populi]GHD04987.1 hypothetical protein GCM10016234_00270 [Tianweitania populi]